MGIERHPKMSSSPHKKRAKTVTSVPSSTSKDRSSTETSEPYRVGILGSGNWGSAIAINVLASFHFLSAPYFQRLKVYKKCKRRAKKN